MLVQEIKVKGSGTGQSQSLSKNSPGTSRKGSVTISSQDVSNITKKRSDEDRLAESFTALKKALKDDKK